MLSDASYNDQDASLLHFGDRLLQIDGVNVENCHRSEVVARIKSAQQKVVLLVKKDENFNTSSSSASSRSVCFLRFLCIVGNVL